MVKGMTQGCYPLPYVFNYQTEFMLIINLENKKGISTAG